MFTEKIKTKGTISPQDQPDVLYIQMQHSLFGFDKHLSIIQYSFGEFMFLVLIYTCLPNIGILCAANSLLVHCYWSWRLYGPVYWSWPFMFFYTTILFFGDGILYVPFLLQIALNVFRLNGNFFTITSA